MLLLIVAWNSLICVCWLFGTAIINWIRGTTFERSGDRFIVAVWLGIIALSISLMTVSIIIPLSPLTGVLIILIMVAVALRSHDTKDEIAVLRSSPYPKYILGLLLLELAMARLVVTQPMEYYNYDLGLYHFGVIRWLSQFGTVPGVALIHSRFGFTSSWFALSAPFNAGIIEGRIGGLTNNLVYIIAILQFSIGTVRCLKNRAKVEDYFIVIAFSIVLPNTFLYTGGCTANDLPVILITVVVAWSIMSILKNQEEIYRKSGCPSRNARLIPLLLSAGAMTMKLSAIPLVVISGLLYVFSRRRVAQNLFFSILITMIILLPVLVSGMITSGCPLYPGEMCLDVPWSVGAEHAKEMSKIILSWAQWIGVAPAHANSWNWLWPWLKNKNLITFLLVSAIIATVGIARESKTNPIEGQGWLLALAGLGTAFGLYKAPDDRFLIGYICILPALLIAGYASRLPGQGWFLALAVFVITFITYRFHYGYFYLMPALLIAMYWTYPIKHNLNILSSNQLTRKITLTFVLVWFGFLIFHKSFSMIEFMKTGNIFGIISNPMQLLLPPKMKAADVLQKRVNDIDYFMPVSGERCWAAEIPCTPYLTHEDIKLRDPERGIGSGFVRENQWE